MSDHSEHDKHPTVERMEEVAKGLFRNTDNQEGPKPDLESEKVNWRERVRRWFGVNRKRSPGDYPPRITPAYAMNCLKRSITQSILFCLYAYSLLHGSAYCS